MTPNDAQKYYQQHIANKPAEKEVKARHILVKTKDQAVDIFEKIAHGASFEDMARQHSADPGTKMQGGLLGYFGKGRMVPQFEQTAFKLARGEISDPVQSQFGWHLIKVEDVRTKPVPKFADVKEQILMSMIHAKTKQIAGGLRQSAQVEYVDPAIRNQVEAETKQ